jgi:hypothetical protein
MAALTSNGCALVLGWDRAGAWLHSSPVITDRLSTESNSTAMSDGSHGQEASANHFRMLHPGAHFPIIMARSAALNLFRERRPRASASLRTTLEQKIRRSSQSFELVLGRFP